MVTDPIPARETQWSYSKQNEDDKFYIFEAYLREIVSADQSCFFSLGSAAAGDDAHDTSTASTSYCGTCLYSQPRYGDNFSGSLMVCL
jgi:hypothetical protein